MRRLGPGNDALAAGEPHRRLEGLVLAVRLSIDEPRPYEPAQHRRIAVITQAARMDRRGHEVVSEREHRHQRREPGGVAEVVAVDALGQGRAGGRLGGQKARFRVAAQDIADEREAQPGEVGTAADAADHDVRLIARHRHLGRRLLPDHSLMQAHVIEDRAERIVRVLPLRRNLDGLGDRDPERAGSVLGVGAARLREVARRAVHGRPPGLHHRATVGLLVIARSDHEDLALEPEQRAGERQG